MLLVSPPTDLVGDKGVSSSFEGTIGMTDCLGDCGGVLSMLAEVLESSLLCKKCDISLMFGDPI